MRVEGAPGGSDVVELRHREVVRRARIRRSAWPPPRARTGSGGRSPPHDPRPARSRRRTPPLLRYRPGCAECRRCRGESWRGREQVVRIRQLDCPAAARQESRGGGECDQQRTSSSKRHAPQVYAERRPLLPVLRRGLSIDAWQSRAIRRARRRSGRRGLRAAPARTPRPARPPPAPLRHAEGHGVVRASCRTAASRRAIRSAGRRDATPITTPPTPSPSLRGRPGRRTVRSMRAERHADADLTRPLRDCVREHAEDADRRKHQRDAGEEREQRHVEAGLRDRSGDDLLERADVPDRQVAIDRVHGAAGRVSDGRRAARRSSARPPCSEPATACRAR